MAPGIVHRSDAGTAGAVAGALGPAGPPGPAALPAAPAAPLLAPPAVGPGGSGLDGGDGRGAEEEGGAGTAAVVWALTTGEADVAAGASGCAAGRAGPLEPGAGRVPAAPRLLGVTVAPDLCSSAPASWPPAPGAFPAAPPEADDMLGCCTTRRRVPVVHEACSGAVAPPILQAAAPHSTSELATCRLNATDGANEISLPPRFSNLSDSQRHTLPPASRDCAHSAPRAAMA